jgi:hypothetical protein
VVKPGLSLIRAAFLINPLAIHRSSLAKAFGVDPGVPLFAKVEGFFVFSAVTQHSLPILVNKSTPQKAQFTPKNPQFVPYPLNFCPISVKHCLEFRHYEK